MFVLSALKMPEDPEVKEKGYASPDPTDSWSEELAFVIEKEMVSHIENMEEKLTSGCMQCKVMKGGMLMVVEVMRGGMLMVVVRVVKVMRGGMLMVVKVMMIVVVVGWWGW